MRKPILVPTGLLKESFFEINRKYRRNIYIYLWYISGLGYIVFWVEDVFFLGIISEIVFPPLISFLFTFLFIINLFALVSLKLNLMANRILEWYTKVFIFGIYIQILPFLYIFLGISTCFELLTGQDPIYIFSSILDLIVSLWILRYVLVLRRYALNKMETPTL